MRKFKLLLDDYESIAGSTFYDAFVKRYEQEANKRRCAYCGKRNPFTKDHVIPKSKGGSNDKSNLVWCCMSCNARKHARTPEEAGMEIKYPIESEVK